MAFQGISRSLLKQATAQVRHVSSSTCLSSSPSTASNKFYDYWPVEGSPVAPADSYYTWDVTKPVKLHMTDEYPGNLNAVTVPAMFKVSLEAFPGHLAMADRRGPGNEWKKWNYEQYHEETYAAARGFNALGLNRFGGIGILGRNSPEWFMSCVGCIAAGGLPVGLYNTSSAEIIAYIAGHAPFDIFCVEDQAELDRVLQGKGIEEVLPTVKKIVFLSPDATNINSDKVITWKDLIMLGRSESDSHIRHIEKTQCANEACALVYTSGTTGMPKGAILSHDNITGVCKVGMEFMGFHHGEEVLLSYLPSCHVASLVVDAFMMMHIGAAVYCADKNALKGTLVDNLKEVRPTILVAVPRVFEKIEERLQEMGRKNKGIKKAVMDWAKAAASEHHRRAREEGKAPEPTLGYKIAKKVIFNQLHKALGIDRICGHSPAGIYIGGAALAKSTVEYFESLDINLLQGYGLTETTTMITINLHDGENRPGSVGKVGIGVGFQIMNSDKEGLGEIACRSRNVFMGYHKDEAKTKETFTEDNWLLSGDLGRLDEDGYLEIKGRLKEIIITSGGKNVAPVPIEEEIKKELEGLVTYAIAIGDNRKYLTCLLTLQVEADPATMQPTDNLTKSVRSWSGRIIGKAAANKLKTVQDFLNCPQYPELRAAIQKAIDRANSRASSPVATVKAFAFLPTEPTVQSGELSPTLKIKRFYLNQKYADLINKMYGNGNVEDKESDKEEQPATAARQAQ